MFVIECILMKNKLLANNAPKSLYKFSFPPEMQEQIYSRDYVIYAGY